MEMCSWVNVWPNEYVLLRKRVPEWQCAFEKTKRDWMSVCSREKAWQNDTLILSEREAYLLKRIRMASQRSALSKTCGLTCKGSSVSLKFICEIIVEYCVSVWHPRNLTDELLIREDHELSVLLKYTCIYHWHVTKLLWLKQKLTIDKSVVQKWVAYNI